MSHQLNVDCGGDDGVSNDGARAREIHDLKGVLYFLNGGVRVLYDEVRDVIIGNYICGDCIY